MTRPALATLVLLAIASAAAAQAPPPAPALRFHHPLPAAADVVVRRDVAYARQGGADVLLDVYRPAKKSARGRPVLIFAATRHDRPQRSHPVYTGWGAAATAAGVVGIVPDAAPDFATGFDAVLAYVREHAAELDADPERIAVYAASANVIQTLPLLQDPKRTAVKAGVMYYGVVNGAPAFRPDLPILFVRAGLDRPGLNRALDSLLAGAIRANAPVRVINFAGGHHGFEIADDTDGTREVIDETLRFVVQATEPGSRAALRAGMLEARAAGAMQSGDFAGAAAIYATMKAEKPDDARLRLSYGEALVGAGRFREASAEFETLKGARLGPRDLGVPAARAAAGAGDAEGAVAWLKTIPRQFLPRELEQDPAFAALREREDFRALFR